MSLGSNLEAELRASLHEANYLSISSTWLSTRAFRLPLLTARLLTGRSSAVHNFCTSQKAVASNQNLQAHRGGSSQSRSTYRVKRSVYKQKQQLTSSRLRTAHLLGEELYKLLGEYLSRHLSVVYKESQSHSEEALLGFYIREWGRYTTAAKYVNHLFSYLNRHWVKREIDEGKKNVYDV